MLQNIKINLCCVIIGIGLLTCSHSTQSQTKQLSPEITVNDLYKHIKYLASDSLTGRKPGSKGDSLAANYIINNLLSCGLTPIADNGFQKFEIITKSSLGNNNRLQINEDELTLNKDFIPLSYTANDTLNAQVVFAGYGFDIETDSIKWHDYTNIDVKRKWVMVLRGDPEMDKTHSFYTKYSSDRKKTLIAADKKAAGILLVSGVEFDEKDKLQKLNNNPANIRAGIPVVHITRKTANKILSLTNQTVENLEKKMNKELQSTSFAVDAKVNANIEVIYKKTYTQNIIAYLRANNQNATNETVVIGAHYDHLGLGGRGTSSRSQDTIAIHNGADDNASGVAAVLELACKLAQKKQNLKRNVIFVAFGAEEMGLIGSKYFVKNNPIPDDSIILMMNFDMVGRLDTVDGTLMIGGTGTFAECNTLLDKHQKKFKIKTERTTGGYGPSDHASFYADKIPVLYFFSGTHNDYHTPADDTEKINFKGEKTIVRLSYNLVYDILTSEMPVTYQQTEEPEDKGERRRFKVTLGIVPDFAGIEKKGLRVDGVRKGRPAYKAGMKKGDIITAMDGKPVKNIYDYMNRLNEYAPNQRISVEILRNGNKRILIVDF